MADTQGARPSGLEEKLRAALLSGRQKGGPPRPPIIPLPQPSTDGSTGNASSGSGSARSKRTRSPEGRGKGSRDLAASLESLWKRTHTAQASQGPQATARQDTSAPSRFQPNGGGNNNSSSANELGSAKAPWQSGYTAGVPAQGQAQGRGQGNEAWRNAGAGKGLDGAADVASFSSLMDELAELESTQAQAAGGRTNASARGASTGKGTGSGRNGTNIDDQPMTLFEQPISEKTKELMSAVGFSRELSMQEAMALMGLSPMPEPSPAGMDKWRSTNAQGGAARREGLTDEDEDSESGGEGNGGDAMGAPKIPFQSFVGNAESGLAGEEDFLRGLEGLSSAFGELGDLLLPFSASGTPAAGPGESPSGPGKGWGLGRQAGGEREGGLEDNTVPGDSSAEFMDLLQDLMQQQQVDGVPTGLGATPAAGAPGARQGVPESNANMGEARGWQGPYSAGGAEEGQDECSGMPSAAGASPRGGSSGHGSGHGSAAASGLGFGSASGCGNASGTGPGSGVVQAPGNGVGLGSGANGSGIGGVPSARERLVKQQESIAEGALKKLTSECNKRKEEMRVAKTSPSSAAPDASMTPPGHGPQGSGRNNKSGSVSDNGNVSNSTVRLSVAASSSTSSVSSRDEEGTSTPSWSSVPAGTSSGHSGRAAAAAASASTAALWDCPPPGSGPHPGAPSSWEEERSAAAAAVLARVGDGLGLASPGVPGLGLGVGTGVRTGADAGADVAPGAIRGSGSGSDAGVGAGEVGVASMEEDASWELPPELQGSGSSGGGTLGAAGTSSGYTGSGQRQSSMSEGTEGQARGAPGAIGEAQGDEARQGAAGEGEGPDGNVPGLGGVPASGPEVLGGEGGEGGEDPIQLLIVVAKAIVSGDQPTVHRVLTRLNQLASVYGDVSQRLSAYFLEGLLARLSGTAPKHLPSDPSGLEPFLPTPCNPASLDRGAPAEGDVERAAPPVGAEACGDTGLECCDTTTPSGPAAPAVALDAAPGAALGSLGPASLGALASGDATPGDANGVPTPRGAVKFPGNPGGAPPGASSATSAVSEAPAKSHGQCNFKLLESFQVLVNSSPYLTFGQVAANSAILEALVGESHVHIIDFGIGHALQWPALLQALAARPGGPPHVRLTGIETPQGGPRKPYCVYKAGARLTMTAKMWGVPFEYFSLQSRLEDVRPEMLKLHKGEAVAVNCALRLSQLLDEAPTPGADPRSSVLRCIRQLQPKVCVVVEQVSNLNSPFFLSRFYEALYYYALLFESFDASLPRNTTARRVFEEQVLGRSIVNLVACEGQERVERQETLWSWQQRMQRAGFKPHPVTDTVMETAQALLATYKKVGHEVVREDEGSLLLTWKERPLLAMTAWGVA